ncbi:hypothetical protein BFJ69_g17041 [Fusarium oxysporum]|uniref:Uncharacterized protein n=1 Tax=Fusarium oxysporum TaxID=5507 RepID=A0A420M9F7_FUSOX|nr:hypothetical protein BFJ69_g17041 [Fusarium oxysporum]
MVEHQRRSHQYGMNPNDILYECSSDSEDDEPPLTPQSPAMSWSPRDVVSMDQAIMHGPIHRPTSYADFDHMASLCHSNTPIDTAFLQMCLKSLTANPYPAITSVLQHRVEP